MFEHKNHYMFPLCTAMTSTLALLTKQKIFHKCTIHGKSHKANRSSLELMILMNIQLDVISAGKINFADRITLVMCIL